jgi:hypothetical protein
MFAIGVRIVVMPVTSADGEIGSKIVSIVARIAATAVKTCATVAKIAAIVVANDVSV